MTRNRKCRNLFVTSKLYKYGQSKFGESRGRAMAIYVYSYLNRKDWKILTSGKLWKKYQDTDVTEFHRYHFYLPSRSKSWVLDNFSLTRLLSLAH